MKHRKSVRDFDFYIDEYMYNCQSRNNPAKLTSIAAFDYGYCDSKILNGYAIHDNMSKALDKVLLEGADIQTALNDAAEQAWKKFSSPVPPSSPWLVNS